MRAYIVWPIAIFVFLADRVSKLLILRELELNESFEVIKNIFYLTLVRNTGAAFGIFRNQALFFVIVSILSVAAIIIYIRKLPEMPPAVKAGLGLIMGGAVGNLVDRVCFGYVIDFLDFRIWPVFNLADSAITVGAILLVIDMLRIKRQKSIF